ncbi:hypothetical protein [Nocardia sp. NPDC048505]|uniref:hypothetical protein n=1 Tax=unclassified Nocardia TaxID=2637762 RepID=UPI0033D67196
MTHPTYPLLRRLGTRLARTRAALAARLRLLALGLATAAAALAVLATSAYFFLSFAAAGLSELVPRWVAMLILAGALGALGLALVGACSMTIRARARRR